MIQQIKLMIFAYFIIRVVLQGRFLTHLPGQIQTTAVSLQWNSVGAGFLMSRKYL